MHQMNWKYDDVVLRFHEEAAQSQIKTISQGVSDTAMAGANNACCNMFSQQTTPLFDRWTIRNCRKIKGRTRDASR